MVGQELATSFESEVCAYSHTMTSSRMKRRWVLPATFLPNGRDARYPEGDPEGCYPTLLVNRTTRLAPVTQLADVPVRIPSQWQLRGWGELCASSAVEQQMSLPLHVESQGHKLFVIGRSHTYTVNDLQVAHAIQRLLICVDRQVRAFSAWQHATGDAWSIAADETNLTPREVVVVALIAQGLTAAAAARRLAISTRTVHKHLERIYSKLGV